jgi:hypothetical protein
VLSTTVNYSFRGEGETRPVALKETPYGEYLENEWNGYYKRHRDAHFLYVIPGNTEIMLHIGVDQWNDLDWSTKAEWYDVGVEAFEKLLNQYRE